MFKPTWILMDHVVFLTWPKTQDLPRCQSDVPVKIFPQSFSTYSSSSSASWWYTWSSERHQPNFFLRWRCRRPSYDNARYSWPCFWDIVRYRTTSYDIVRYNWFASVAVSYDIVRYRTMSYDNVRCRTKAIGWSFFCLSSYDIVGFGHRRPS